MLRCQYQWWADWPPELRRRVEIIIVDDGSKNRAEWVPLPTHLPLLRIYRVKEDIPWHQHGARNLGAHEACNGWMLMTDMDHVLTQVSAMALLLAKLDPERIYTLDRVEADTGKSTLGKDGKPKPHPNSFVLTRELYWRIGGYDEDFTGIYGTDSLFRERAFSIGKRGHLAIPLTRYWRDIIPDASTNGLPRKEGRDPNARARILAAKRARGEEGKVKVLQFDWERVL